MRVGNHQTLTVSGANVVGNHNRITGNGNTITGNHNTVVGNANSFVGNHNLVDGDKNRCTGNHNHMTGVDNNAVGSYNKINGEDQGGMTILSGQSIVVDGSGIWIDGVRHDKKQKSKEPKFIQVPTEDEAKKHDREAPEDAPTACSVCLTNELCCAVLPCMHRCLCCKCARELAADGTKQRGQVACPLCKTDVKKIKLVY